MTLFKYFLDETHRLIQQPLTVEEKPISYMHTLLDNKKKYIKKSIIGQIDPETDTLYSLSDNKASAAELFVDLFTKRKETYTHMASVMDYIIQTILKDGGIDN